MSTLKVTNIQATGETATRAVSGVAAAFERHNLFHTIDQSMNVSSITDNGSGDTTVTYINAFSTANQCLTGAAGDQDTSHRIVSTIQKEASAATKHRYFVTNSTFTGSDCPVNCSIAHGDLA